MEKKKISNFTIVFVTVFMLIIAIFVGTIVNLNSNHNDKLIYSTKEQIKYAAKRCYLDNKCENNMTIQDLYDNGYLDEVTNPVTKEVLDPTLTITYINNETVLNFEL